MDFVVIVENGRKILRQFLIVIKSYIPECNIEEDHIRALFCRNLILEVRAGTKLKVSSPSIKLNRFQLNYPYNLVNSNQLFIEVVNSHGR